MKEQLSLTSRDRFAVFRMPGTQHPRLFLSLSRDLKRLERADYRREGYVVQPFLKEDIAYFIAADRKYEHPQWRFEPSGDHRVIPMKKKAYLSMVEQGISALGPDLPKVILSRQIMVPLHRPSADRYFRDLCSAYPNAFVFFWNTPETGAWMGASPEPLVRERPSGMLETVALAGTRPSNGEDSEWGVKEIEEHRMVVDYIREVLAQTVRQCEVGETHTIRAGKVEHLRTIFVYPKILRPDLLVNHLHPTPAVCGLPPDKAYALIREIEPYSRAYYTGYSGLVGPEIHLYVTLRCMQIFGGAACLYVGGGITRSSSPLLEWEETLWKAQTMQLVL